LQERETGSGNAELRVSPEEARSVANLLRYAVSLNTTVGLVSPAERRLATPTYKAIELAALVLEGKTFHEALEGSRNAWTGSLENDHRRALEMIQTHREALIKAMSGRLGPEALAEYLEVTQEQFLELVRSGLARPKESDKPPK
jgi:hypothetical protein